VNCDELTPEEAAEIEARTRASLLTDTGAGIEVRLRCELGTASVLAIAGDRSASAVLALPQPALKDALVEAVEKTLQELEQRALTPSAPSTTPLVPPAGPAPAPLPAPLPCAACKQIETRPPDSTATRTERAPNITLGALALAAFWGGRFAYGGRVLVATNGPRWSAGAAVGGLTSVTHPSAFTPVEWHAVALASFDSPALGGIRSTAGVGISTLVAKPHAGVVASSGTALPAPFGELGVERPFRTGHLALVPALGVRFEARRDVVVDGHSRFELPVVVPQAFVGVTYAL